MAKLMLETVNDVTYHLQEREGGQKSYFIEGPFMVADVGNKNGRFYPRKVLYKALEDFIPLVKEKKAVGELGHPSGPGINLERVSHLITELRADGNQIIGKAKVLDTPYGKIVQNFLNEGMKPGVSTRGLGTLKPADDGLQEVQDDFRLITVDIVNDPSGPGCFVAGIMENVDWVLDAAGNWRQQETIAEIVKEAKKLSPKQLDEARLRVWANIMKSLK